MATEWWQKENGKIRDHVDFTVYVQVGLAERKMSLRASSPPIYDQDPDLFTRLSFESIRDWFRVNLDMDIDHIIRGEVMGSGGYRECLVFARGRQVPVAVIRPTVFTKS